MSEQPKYGTVNSVARGGWCVFWLGSELTISFHAGPFESEAQAESEAKRLNELEA